ncbi:MAG: peroxiredoxin family protein [Chloroflexi bacterium]|nr:peroxiredoxin family protein [Chloroflexota bacterium]
MQRNYGSFQNAGAEVVALAVASLSSVDGARQTVHAAYPMLSDADHQTAEAFDVYNLLGDRLAAPSVFIIDTDGRITWSHIGQNATDRPNVQKILEKLPEAIND